MSAPEGRSILSPRRAFAILAVAASLAAGAAVASDRVGISDRASDNGSMPNTAGRSWSIMAPASDDTASVASTSGRSWS
jgi:hypothetical protein